MAKRVPVTVHLLVLAVALVASAFQMGYASGTRRHPERRRTAVVEAVAHAAPAVASVSAYRTSRRTKAAGSGVIIHPAGYVVTNSHVIEGADRIRVQLWQSSRSIAATVVANDPRGDLALLKLQGSRTWPYVSLAATSEVIPGETAIAIGNPRGLGDSITVGVVSAVRRSAKVESGGTLGNLIQTDASINTGNSGGPLLNLEGELIGINTSILPRASGIAFAIPADDVQLMVTRTIGRCAPRNPLPAEASPIPPPAMASDEAPARAELVPLRPSDLGLTLVDDGARLVIRRVRRGSPAATAGLLPGDVLLDIDGLPVEALDDVVLAFQASSPGRRYEIRGRRGEQVIFAVLVSPS
jgi:S1-C subfamily serine protease